jgi:hypothetical protein
MTQVQLAERFGTTALTVRRALRRAGVATRGQGANRRVFTSDEQARMEDLYRDGMSQEHIAQELGTTQSKVSRILRSRGVRSGRTWLEGTRHPRWKAGRVATSGGYIAVVPTDDLARAMVPYGSAYVLEHRLVMAHALGRPLTKEETVHHINGVKDDNRLENLQLRRGKHGRGEILRCRACGSHDIETVTIA